MTTESALLAAVLATPADDLPRLVYADWCDENGQPERAEFIRVQCELSGTEFEARHKLRRSCACDPCVFARKLWPRERSLFEANSREWFGVDNRGGVAVSLDNSPGPFPQVYGIVRRGFVAEVRCTLADWCGGECWTCGPAVRGGLGYISPHCQDCRGTGRTPGIGPEVVRRHPVEVVRLTDREPLRVGQNWYAWHFADNAVANNTTVLSRKMLWSGRRWDEIVGDLPGFKHANTDPDGEVVRIHFNSEAEAIESASRLALLWAKFQPHPARVTFTPESVDLTAV